jgi:hypothetical protein
LELSICIRSSQANFILVRISQIWGFCGNDYEDYHLLGCDAM